MNVNIHDALREKTELAHTYASALGRRRTGGGRRRPHERLMAERHHCGRHNLLYDGPGCPRCEAEAAFRAPTYPTEDAYLRACRALHWAQAQLRSNGVEPDAIPLDAPHYLPDGHVFENRRTK